MNRSLSISHVFWLLLCSVFVFALLSQAAAVWLTARPFLLQSQKNAAAVFVEREAARISHLTEPASALSQYLASEPSIISYVLGDVQSIGSIIERLDRLSYPEGLKQLIFFDFDARQIARYEVPGNPSPFSGQQTAAVNQEAAGAAHSSIQHGKPHSKWIQSADFGATQDGFILIGVPVVHQGLVEGSVVAVVRISIGAGMQGEGMNSTPMQIISGDSRAYEDMPHVAPVTARPLYVTLAPDAGLVSQAGQELVSRTTLAVSLALLLPFAAFAFGGRHAILLPHRFLEASRNQLKSQQKELAELASIARRAEEAMIVTDLDQKIVWTNPAFTRMSGFKAEEAKGQTPGKLLQGDATDPVEKHEIRKALDVLEPVRVELINYSRTGHPYWIRLSISPLFDEDQNPYGFMSVASDISEQKAQEARLRHAHAEIERQALHDELTGLENRRSFNATFEERCVVAPGETLIVLRIDLDHFKNVNDTMGHEAGDVVLCHVAELLRDQASEKDHAVRMGGDEFVLLFNAGRTLEEALSVAEALRSSISRPIPYDNKLIQTGASFGLASSCTRLTRPEELIRAADAALYHAKETGRNQICVYDETLHRSALNVRKTAAEIRKGIENGEFVPFFQPQFDALTHEISGVEVLARWQHPDRGILPPSEFLDVARQLSLLTKIDAVVSERALKDVGRLAKAGLKLPKVSFNVTADRLADPELVDLVSRTKVEGTSVSFEILESVFLDDQPDYLDFALDLIRDKGLSIEIDDFGSGHASMISLINVRPDVLKIDQRLVSGAPSSPVCRKMVRAVIDIAGSLGISVTAEGVETAEHADLMRDMGCKTLQGYHFARPVCFDDLRALLDGKEGSGKTTSVA